MSEKRRKSRGRVLFLSRGFSFRLSCVYHALSSLSCLGCPTCRFSLVSLLSVLSLSSLLRRLSVPDPLCLLFRPFYLCPHPLFSLPLLLLPSFPLPLSFLSNIPFALTPRFWLSGRFTRSLVLGDQILLNCAASDRRETLQSSTSATLHSFNNHCVRHVSIKAAIGCA